MSIITVMDIYNFDVADMKRAYDCAKKSKTRLGDWLRINSKTIDDLSDEKLCELAELFKKAISLM